MSSLIVEVCIVDAVDKHPSADLLEVVTVKGWRTCVKKGQFKQGDTCVFIPPDAVLPEGLSEALGVTKYLSPVKRDGTLIGFRVRVARLRSEPSYGLVMALPPTSAVLPWVVGTDVATQLGITKWEPPQTCTDGDAERPNPSFHRYYDMENYLNFPDLIPEGEEVKFTEKVHGRNWRGGIVREPDENGVMQWVFAAGSHDVRRKPTCQQRKRRENPETGEVEFYYVERKCQFWEVFDKLPRLKEMISKIASGGEAIPIHNVVVFGEIYGSGVQDMAYGLSNGAWDLRVFDITVDGKYLSHYEVAFHCNNFDIPMVNVLYRGPFSKAKVEEYVSGPTTMCDQSVAGSFKEREGIVISTMTERPVVTKQKVFERSVLKAINFKYLERKNATEQH